MKLIFQGTDREADRLPTVINAARLQGGWEGSFKAGLSHRLNDKAGSTRFGGEIPGTGKSKQKCRTSLVGFRK